MAITALLFNLLLPVSRSVKLTCFAGIFFFLCTYGMMIGGFDEVTQRFSRFFAGAQGRFEIWADSLSMLKSHLLTGIGMGNYELLSLVYLDNVAEKVWFDRAHNEYLELAIELGIIFAVPLYLWLLAGVVRHFRLITKIMAAKKAGAALHMYSTLELTAIAAFSSLIAFMIHGCVDLVWRLPANMVYLISLLAILAVAAKSNEGTESTGGKKA